ncbi:hypothetical protein WBJ53_25145 [Spirosoma sp. SC4-14]|uniref:hypothetical protein n=1 Tax=Spirosoma sp. SC4-14 TaxID=3128900 RepID=UPI0030CC716D
MAVIKLGEWPLGFDEGLEVGYARLDGYWVPLPPRKIWYDSAEGTAVLISENGKKRFLITLAISNSGISDTIIQWVERNGFGKIATGALRSFASKLLGSGLAGGIVGGIAGVLVPTNKSYKEWTSKTTINGETVGVMVLLLGF